MKKIIFTTGGTGGHIYPALSIAKKIREKNHAFEISMLDITGRDLMDMGIQKGPEIGEILEYLLKKVIKSPELNNKNSLMALVKEKFLWKG